MTRLSSEQKAVLQIHSDTLLVAGAGAGKTSTLVASIEHDLRTISPGNLAIVTFTRIAAASIRSRLEEVFFEKEDAPDLSALWIGTIDSLAARLLRQRSLQVGQDPEIRPATASELTRIGKQALAEIEYSRDALSRWIDPSRDLLGILQKLDEECVSRGIEPLLLEAGKPDPEPLLQALYRLQEICSPKQQEAIEKDIHLLLAGELPSQKVWGIRKQTPELRAALEAREMYTNGWIDFQGLPAREELQRIFREWRRIRTEISEAEGLWSFADILQLAEDLRVEPFLQKMYVDEAQDTSSAQFRFLRSLVQGVFVCVGDPNQSIYGFRGADLQNFVKETARMKQIRLRDNYRSAPEIIDAVEEVCAPLLDDVQMNSAGDSQKGEVQSFLLQGEGSRAPSPRQEAQEIVPLLQRELQDYEPEEITVLLRSNSDLDTFYDVFRSEGLPVAARKSHGLGREEECRDVRSLLQLLVDPEDEGALLRVLSSPLCGLGPEELLDFSGSLGEGLALLGEPWKEALSRKNQEALSRLATFLLQSFSYDIALETLDTTGARRKNIQHLISILQDLELELGSMSYTLLLEHLDDQAEEAGTSLEGVHAIHLQTVHQAKGEEYSCVVVPRLGRKLPTSSRKQFFLSSEGWLGISLPGGLRDSIAREEEEVWLQGSREEEARLLYVALTRARTKLLLIGGHSKKKPLQGIVSELPCVSELPAKLEKQPVKASQEIRLPRAAFLEEPPVHNQSFSWSELAAWQRCSLRRQLEEWGLSSTHAEGGYGSRQSGLRIHEAIAAHIKGKQPPQLAEEEEKLFQRARIYIPPGSAAEVPFAFSLGKRILRGRVDVVAPGVRIMDWKSGSEEVFREDYALQRRIYALAWLLRGAPQVCAETIYLRSEEREIEEWTQGDLESLEAETSDLVEEILHQDPEPAAKEPQPFCAGCPGRQLICPVASFEAGE